MSGQETLVNKIVTRIKNNPIIAAIILLGSLVITLATFTNALRDQIGIMPVRESAPAVDISGYWTVAQQEGIPYTVYNF